MYLVFLLLSKSRLLTDKDVKGNYAENQVFDQLIKNIKGLLFHFR